MGFDFLIDRYFKPLLLEVNCSPSFATDSAIDYKIKKNVVADAFKLLNLDWEKRKQWVEKDERDTEIRLRTGKVNKPTREEREALKKQRLAERF